MGVPLELYHDQGKEFQSKVMKKLAETFGCRQTTTQEATKLSDITFFA
jgi:hypothetical protein